MAIEMDFRFAAAHRLPRHPGKCFNLHGHNYELTVVVRGVPDATTGLVMDFADIETVVRRDVLEQCDHANLNDFLENPTAENIVVWMWEHLQPALPGLSELRLEETADCRVVYRGET
jgi:6-pyruvoyltetrahydropterin/6-carboxytetrahydropterin synthase